MQVTEPDTGLWLGAGPPVQVKGFSLALVPRGNHQSLLPGGELPEGNVCLYCFILGSSEADTETKGQCTKKGDRIDFQAHSVLDSWAQSPADSESQERAAPCEGGELLAAPRGVNSPSIPGQLCMGRADICSFKESPQADMQLLATGSLPGWL